MIALFSGLGSDQFTGVGVEVRDFTIEVNPSGAVAVVLIREVIVSLPETGEIPESAIEINGIDAAESVGAVITVFKIAVLNEEVIALFIAKASDCIVIS